MAVKIEILTLEGCPHGEATLRRTLEALSALGAPAEVSEVVVRDGADAERLRFPGSPTVRIDGADIEPGADARSPGALSCRMYGGSGVPPRELLVDAISRASDRSEPIAGGRSATEEAIMAERRRVEIYSAGCGACEDTIRLVRRLVCDSCEVVVHDMTDPDASSRARRVGVRSVPAVAVDGRLAACCVGRGPDEASLRAAGIGQPL